LTHIEFDFIEDTFVGEMRSIRKKAALDLRGKASGIQSSEAVFFH
jgi:hypothetical protein